MDTYISKVMQQHTDWINIYVFGIYFVPCMFDTSLALWPVKAHCFFFPAVDSLNCLHCRLDSKHEHTFSLVCLRLCVENMLVSKQGCQN